MAWCQLISKPLTNNHPHRATISNQRNHTQHQNQTSLIIIIIIHILIHHHQQSLGICNPHQHQPTSTSGTQIINITTTIRMTAHHLNLDQPASTIHHHPATIQHQPPAPPAPTPQHPSMERGSSTDFNHRLSPPAVHDQQRPLPPAAAARVVIGASPL